MWGRLLVFRSLRKIGAGICLAFVTLLAWLSPRLCRSGDIYVADFLDVPVDAHSVALGVNGVASGEGPSSVFASPANVIFGARPEIQLTYGGLYGGFGSGLAHQQGFFARIPLRGGAGFGVAIVRFAVDDIPRYGELGSASFLERLEGAANLPGTGTLGYFSDDEVAVVGAFGRGFPVRIGLNWFVEKIDLFPYVGLDFKMLFQSLDVMSARGAGFDVGAGVKIDLRQFSETWWLGCLNVAWVGRDVGNTTLVWSNRVRQSRLYSWAWGFSYGMSLARSFEATWYAQLEGGRDLPGAVGVRLGYKSVRLTVGMRDRQPGFALNFWFGHFGLSYGTSNAALGETQRIDVTWSF